MGFSGVEGEPCVLWVMGKEREPSLPSKYPMQFPRFLQGHDSVLMGVFQAQALEVNTRPIHNFPPTQDFKSYLSKQSAAI